ncbi:MAG: hypothetical protein LC791_14815 [Acidobacteria bacterium]|nr:hypothetical protein [Acidobacteriota bacterium]
MTKPRAALWAGFIAISVNTIVLKAAEPLGFLAESGGLLRLHVLYLSPLFQSLGISGWWAAASLPPPSALPFWLAFHYLTGFVMVVLYSTVFERLLPGRGLIKGSLFSLLPWFVNGLVVLPVLGQGVFGYQRLPLSGMAYFFVANWSFGGVLGVLYEKFRTWSRPRAKR